MKKIALLAACIISIFVLGQFVACVAQDIGQKAPGFTLADVDGKGVSLSQYEGKVIILNFFADWCPPCRQEIPDFIALQKAYGPAGFTTIGVAVVGRDDAKRFSTEEGINYPVLVDDGKVSATYGPIRSIPTTFIIDKNGKVVKKYIGSRPKAVFETDIKSLL